MLFPKRLVYTLQGLWCLFIFCQRQTDLRFQLTPRTLWCHQPYSSQSLNSQTVVEFEGQEVESCWVSQKVLSLVVQKHSYKLNYQDKFLVLKHSSLTVSCVSFSKTSLVLSHTCLLQEKYEKLLEQFKSLGDG